MERAFLLMPISYNKALQQTVKEWTVNRINAQNTMSFGFMSEAVAEYKMIRSTVVSNCIQNKFSVLLWKRQPCGDLIMICVLCWQLVTLISIKHEYCKMNLHTVIVFLLPLLLVHMCWIVVEADSLVFCCRNCEITIVSLALWNFVYCSYYCILYLLAWHWQQS